jgi:hypothetical protein
MTLCVAVGRRNLTAVDRVGNGSLAERSVSAFDKDRAGVQEVGRKPECQQLTLQQTGAAVGLEAAVTSTWTIDSSGA